METYVNVALGVGYGIKRRKDEFEVCHPRHALQIIAELFYLRLCKGRIDIQIARIDIVDMFIQHEGYVASFT